MDEQVRRGISLSPKTMVDNVSDWPLHRVVEHLRKKEKEDKDHISGVDLNCRIFCRSGVRFFDSVVEEVAIQYGVSKGRMCRWLSYHGMAIIRDDIVISQLSDIYARIRREALVADNPDIADIINALIPYSPRERTGDGKSIFYVYNSWVSSGFADYSRVCGVGTGQVAQAFMLRSVLTSDLPLLESVADRLCKESERWDKWMRFRALVLEKAVEMWGEVK